MSKPESAWVAVAEAIAPDIPRENVEAFAPVLDTLMEAFRPLLGQLDLIPTE
jgi:hypothetical protein